MTVRKYKPIIDLDLKSIKFPVTAIASISHRISGVIIFVAVGILLFTLKLSLISTENFYQIKLIVGNLYVKIIIWILLVAFIYHFIGGIRHILMDLGFFNKTLKLGKISANITFVLTAILSVLIGLLLC